MRVRETAQDKTLISQQSIQAALRGKWYHCQRTFIVKASKEYKAIDLNIFERFVKAVFGTGCLFSCRRELKGARVLASSKLHVTSKKASQLGKDALHTSVQKSENKPNSAAPNGNDAPPTPVQKSENKPSSVAIAQVTLPPPITELSFEDKKIGYAEAIDIANTLASNASITELKFLKCAFDKAGFTTLARALVSNASLVKLDLSDNKLGDAEARIIASALTLNTCIKEVYLDNNEIDDSGAHAIADMLMANSSITLMELGGNNIKVAGAKAIAYALGFNNSLAELHLWCNKKIGDEGISAIARALAFKFLYH